MLSLLMLFVCSGKAPQETGYSPLTEAEVTLEL